MDNTQVKSELLFTEPMPTQKMRGIYVLLKNNAVVYVGQSDNIISRVGTHLANPSKSFDSVRYAVVENGDLNEIEADLIVKYQPHLNRILPPTAKYTTPGAIKERLGLDGWEIRRVLKGIHPVWKNYYLVSEFKQAQAGQMEML